MRSSTLLGFALASAQPETGLRDFVREHLPGLTQTSFFGVVAWQWMAMGAALVGAVGVGFVLARLFYWLSRPISKGRWSWLVSLSRAIQRPLAALFALATFDLAVHFIDLVGHISVTVDTVARQLLIGGGAWLLIAAGGSLTVSLEKNLVVADEFESRGARTQLRVAHRALSAILVVVALALILSGFTAVRHIGLSLLASAGIVSIVIGIAAQKALSGLVAGIQLSITQQVRIGDTVVVDTEMGTVEEIHLSFVVLRLWDLRRLIVPATRLLEQPFQNWTRVRTHLLGTVELWVDYSAPLETLRDELARVCKASKRWDGRTSDLRVTDASDKALRVQMLVSAEGSGNLFELRCEVRERIVASLKSLAGGIYLPHDRSSNITLEQTTQEARGPTRNTASRFSPGLLPRRYPSASTAALIAMKWQAAATTTSRWKISW